MSIGFLLSNQDDAVIWRGPRKNGLIKQFLQEVNWGELDYLVIDSNYFFIQLHQGPLTSISHSRNIFNVDHLMELLLSLLHKKLLWLMSENN